MAFICIHILLISIFFLSLNPVFNPIFDLLHIPSGYKSIVIQSINLIFCLTLFVYSKSFNNFRIKKELLLTLLVWVPWIAYLYLRTDINFEYSVLKFGKVFFIHFLGVFTITLFYLINSDTYNKFFLSITIILCFVLILLSIFIPSTFLYASRVERLTLENINPIWLSRSFAIGAICCLFIKSKYSFAKFCLIPIFLILIVLTGSRGPLLSVLIVILIYFAFSKVSKPSFYIYLVVIFSLIFSTTIIFFPIISHFFNGYFNRASNKGIVEESGRLMLFKAAIIDFNSSPLIGVGLGRFYKNKSKYINFKMHNSNTLNVYPHNLPLEILCELGIIGILLFILLLRPGFWLFHPESIYFYLFYLSFLFSLTSGDIISNSGVILFATLSRLEYYNTDLSLV